MFVTPVGFMLDKSLNLSSKYLKKMGVKIKLKITWLYHFLIGGIFTIPKLLVLFS